MQPIKVNVFVSQSTALARGAARYGEASIELSDADVSALSPRARDWLAAHPDQILATTEATPSAACAALEAAAEAAAKAEAEAAAAKAAAKAAEVARREALIAQKLAKPDEAWVSDFCGGLKFVWIPPDIEADPRIVARRAKIERDVLPRLVAEREAQLAAERAAADAAKARREAEAAMTRARAARYVIAHVPDYARSAREGCDVVKPAKAAELAAIGQRLAAASGAPLVESYFCEEQPRPRERAWQVCDAVKAEVARLLESSRTGPSLAASIDVGIVRVDTCAERGCRAGIRTCVRARVAWVDEDYDDVYLYADSDEPHAHESDPDLY